MRGLCVCFPVAAALLLAVCSNSYTPRDKHEEEPPFTQVDELFVPEEIENGQTRTVFATNDTRFWTYEGLTLWTVWGEETKDFDSRTVAMSKSLGYSGGGYGMVFCHGEHVMDGETKPAMLVVMVNNEGNYIIGKEVGGVFTDFGWWKTSPYVRRGMGVTNEVTVTYEEEGGEYRLDINGYFIERFRDDEEPALRGGKDGYIVVVTPYDQFPQSSVAVYFREAL